MLLGSGDIKQKERTNATRATSSYIYIHQHLARGKGSRNYSVNYQQTLTTKQTLYQIRHECRPVWSPPHWGLFIFNSYPMLSLHCSHCSHCSRFAGCVSVRVISTRVTYSFILAANAHQCVLRVAAASSNNPESQVA